MQKRHGCWKIALRKAPGEAALDGGGTPLIGSAVGGPLASGGRSLNLRTLSGVLAIVAALAAASGSFAQEIRIWPTACVTTDAVTLSDVAELRGLDAATVEALGPVVVHAAPREGGEILVRVSDVRGALADAGANLASITLCGNSRCQVSRPRHEPEPPVRKAAPSPKDPSRAKGKRPANKKAAAEAKAPVAASGTSLEAAMRRYIMAKAGGLDGKLEIRFSPANRRDLQIDGPQYRFDVRPRETQVVGLLSYEVDVYQGEELQRTVPIVAEVWLLKEVVSARRSINRGETVEGRDLCIEERRFSNANDVGLTELAAAIGQQSRTFIRPGEMLQPKHLETKPLIGRGDRVMIWSRRGGLVIKTTGRAQREGSIGDVIEVRRDGTKRKQDLLEAVVTGPATVSLDGARQLASSQ